MVVWLLRWRCFFFHFVKALKAGRQEQPKAKLQIFLFICNFHFQRLASSIKTLSQSWEMSARKSLRLKKQSDCNETFLSTPKTPRSTPLSKELRKVINQNSILSVKTKNKCMYINLWCQPDSYHSQISCIPAQAIYLSQNRCNLLWISRYGLLNFQIRLNWNTPEIDSWIP